MTHEEWGKPVRRGREPRLASHCALHVHTDAIPAARVSKIGNLLAKREGDLVAAVLRTDAKPTATVSKIGSLPAEREGDLVASVRPLGLPAARSSNDEERREKEVV